MDDMRIYAKADATGSSLGADIDAWTVISVDLDSKVKIDNITVIGHEIAQVIASSRPVYRNSNIHGYTSVQLNAVGDAYSKVDITLKAKANTNVGGNFVYRGANLTIDAEAFYTDRIKTEAYKGGFIYKHDDEDFCH